MMRILLVTCLFLTLTTSLSAGEYCAGQSEVSYPQKQDPAPEPEISVVGNRLKVDNAPIGTKLEVFSVVGVKVLEIEVKYPEGEYALNIAKGYYIVRLGETVRKIVIR